MDETSFVSWTRISKAWSHRGVSVKVPLPSSRGPGFTLFGCMGTCLRNSVFYKIGSSTSIEEVQEFFVALARQRINPNGRPFLVLDNHAAHRNVETLRIMRQHFQPLFLPAYSCQFNR